MRAELEPEDIRAIASEVAEALRPLLASKAKEPAEDRILTVEALAEYLGVSPSWVYKQVSYRAIPYFKAGNHPRFRKADIDKWIESQSVKPLG